MFNCKPGSKKAYQISSGEREECGHESVLAVKERLQFSIDLKNWFDVGQRCIIETSEKIYGSAVIRNVFEGGKILIENEGEVEYIDYCFIKSIQNFFENTRYIVELVSKKPKIVLSYVKKPGRAKRIS